MSFYLILGAGRFGRLALERLGRRDQEARFLIVDPDPKALAAAVRGLNSENIMAVQAEAGKFLADNLGEDSPWDWIIPTAPVHVAYVWLRQGSLAGEDWQTLAPPEMMAEVAPVVLKGPEEELYLSYAGHLCPDDCTEPDVCPVSGEPRETALSEALAALQVPEYEILVMVSRPLAPGVGGYQPRELWKLGRKMKSCAGKVMIATACRCHGVVHGLERREVSR
ncbi:MAG: hypothetical protein FJ134_06180 [Deltaproteobacteria bacterium]|nr:hypothetical protein [Deltaproteobacteria bacterium]